jgi:nitrile hydratase subunit beta
MDGVHDLGGVQGFGPIEIDDDPRPFKHDWEGRMWGINEAVAGGPGWTLDWWRHVRELLLPLDYLTRPYFDQWAQIYAALLIDSHVATLGEVVKGKPRGAGSAGASPMRAKEVRAAAGRTESFRRETGAKPFFGVGQKVIVRSQGTVGHTRLPRYVRGRPGLVHAYRGIYVLPDAKALGRDEAGPLYTIAFQAGDLWPEAAGRRDRVFVDLWERYLEQ